LVGNAPGVSPASPAGDSCEIEIDLDGRVDRLDRSVGTDDAPTVTTINGPAAKRPAPEYLPEELEGRNRETTRPPQSGNYGFGPPAKIVIERTAHFKN
jgi:hypothetical protein